MCFRVIIGTTPKSVEMHSNAAAIASRGHAYCATERRRQEVEHTAEFPSFSACVALMLSRGNCHVTVRPSVASSRCVSAGANFHPSGATVV
jgi:hypothetical protein